MLALAVVQQYSSPLVQPAPFFQLGLGLSLGAIVVGGATADANGYPGWLGALAGLMLDVVAAGVLLVIRAARRSRGR